VDGEARAAVLRLQQRSASSATHPVVVHRIHQSPRPLT
jgi:hypothetical protein